MRSRKSTELPIKIVRAVGSLCSRRRSLSLSVRVAIHARFVPSIFLRAVISPRTPHITINSPKTIRIYATFHLANVHLSSGGEKIARYRLLQKVFIMRGDIINSFRI